jgi:acyl dehydratase
MTTPATGARTLAATLVRGVTAGEIATYRDVVRSGIAPPGPAAGTPKASPLHAFVLASPAFDQAVSVLNSASRVHLSQEVHLQRLVRPDERVTIEVTMLGARREPRGVRLALRSVLAGGDGSPFAELVTGALLVGATTPDPFGDIPPHPTPGSAAGPAAVVTRQVSTEMVRRYAEASGDDNPIHLNPEAARAAGFPGVIAPGMSVLALVCEEVIDRYAAGDAAAIRGIGGRFSSPVLPGEPLDITFQPDDEGRIVRFSCKTPQGPALKSGWATIGGGKRDGDG